MELALQRRFGVQMLLYMSIRAGNEIAITVLYNAAGHVLSSQLGRDRSLESSVSRSFCATSWTEEVYACLPLSFSLSILFFFIT